MKKSLITFILMFFMLFMLVPIPASAFELAPILIPLTLPDTSWDGTADIDWNGSGTAANPYLISSAEELAGLAVKVNEGNQYKGSYFKLTVDVRLVKDKLRLWTPIGNKNNMFRGNFDGSGHVVSGLYFSDKNADYVGLFGALGVGGTVSNLGILEGEIYADERVGAIAGYSLGLIQNCYNTASIPSYGDYVGGIAGYSGGSIVDCHNAGEIKTKGSSPDYIGGVVGYAGKGTVVGCYNTGEVRGKHKVGGVAGATGGSALVLNCWNTARIYSSNTRTGGIVGHSGSGGLVANCYNTGDVSADGKVGGIVGYSHGAVTINCYNTGHINSHGKDLPAAIVGIADDVAGSFGILGIGGPIKSSYVINCYYLVGTAKYAAFSKPNCFVSGMGRFTSPDSNIIRYDSTSGGGGLLGAIYRLVVDLDEAFSDIIDTAFNIVGAETPESLKKLISLHYHEPFPGDTTVYSGTLLDVLNAGVSGADDSYGKWYGYSNANNGYPVLLKKSDPLFIPISPGGLRPIELELLVPFESEIARESDADIVANSGDFILNPNYPADKGIGVGENAGFSTSLSSSSTYTGDLSREWYMVFDGSEYLVEEGAELNGISFLLENSNLLRVTAGTGAVSGVYQIYCDVSNYNTTVQSRLATLTVRGTEAPSLYYFPFSDVPDSAWYRSDVEIAHKNALINGTTPTTYSPENNMTIAEAIKLAACMHQLYHEGSVTLASGSPWYITYVDYALVNNIISGAYADYDVKINRSEFVNIFYKALPDSEYTAKNTVGNGMIPDVPVSALYSDKIYAFYRAGILTGSDAKGTFNPGSNIKRSEVAAILTRMFDETARRSISLP